LVYYVVILVIFFPVLVCCAKQNLATLEVGGAQTKACTRTLSLSPFF
jgi:hypothetical protein